eukprot:2398720-Prymnesium_polylepis.2
MVRVLQPQTHSKARRPRAPSRRVPAENEGDPFAQRTSCEIDRLPDRSESQRSSGDRHPSTEGAGHLDCLTVCPLGLAILTHHRVPHVAAAA